MNGAGDETEGVREGEQGSTPLVVAALGHEPIMSSSPADRWLTRARRSVIRPRTLLMGFVVLGVVGGLAITSAPGDRAASGGVVIQGRPSLLGYQGQGDLDGNGEEGGGGQFTIAGGASPALYPGTRSTIDLVFTNKTDKAITLPAGAIKITISSPRPVCPASPNFSVVQTLTSAVTIPKNATAESLADLHVTTRSWPVISMVTTHVTQDACAGMTLTLRYSAQVGDDGN